MRVICYGCLGTVLRNNNVCTYHIFLSLYSSMCTTFITCLLCILRAFKYNESQADSCCMFLFSLVESRGKKVEKVGLGAEHHVAQDKG